jgi:hypothetical protein
MNNIKELLENVSSKAKDIDKHQRASGELFNIFSITRIERAEVATHSSMIAELLNPSGSHGQGDKFLTLFLNILNQADSFTGTQNAKVFKEKSFNKGRDRVDILVELKDDVLLIENKVDAEDGNRQLERYSGIPVFYGKKGHLIYLTKYGSDAEEHSHRGVEYLRISYREDILAWLDLCIKEVNTLPAIQQALIQYQYIIRKITGTSMTAKLKKEIVELLITGRNLESANLISESILEAKGEILFRFFQNLELAISESNLGSVIRTASEELEYNKPRCTNWFI